MESAAHKGLDCVPAVDPFIASLVVLPEEAVRPDARSPCLQCRVSDDLLTRGCDTVAQMAQNGNSLSHLVLLSVSRRRPLLPPTPEAVGGPDLQPLGFADYL